MLLKVKYANDGRMCLALSRVLTVLVPAVIADDFQSYQTA